MEPYVLVNDGTDYPWIFEATDDMVDENENWNGKLWEDIEEDISNGAIDMLNRCLEQDISPVYLTHGFDYVQTFIEDDLPKVERELGITHLRVFFFHADDVKEYNNWIIERNFDGEISNNEIANYLFDPRECPEQGSLGRCELMNYLEDNNMSDRIDIIEILKRRRPKEIQELLERAKELRKQHEEAETEAMQI